MQVRDVLRKDVVVFKGDDSVATALQVMNERSINGAPVVDDEHNLIGMVVKADIYRFLVQPGRIDVYPLQLVMSKDVVTASPDDLLINVAKTIRGHNIIAVPVVEQGKVVGLVSLEDIVDYWINLRGR